ncbi:MAG TPA: NADP-dependent phosphogluconate dehydrogenase, partial [Oceanospirillaceae bacterium]|nr:NADP-dependent phosphogluconate dehydrogenase [Oceanospirillaceae bacterium]
MNMKANIGLIGLAVMGENLVLNMHSKGFSVAVFNRTKDKIDRFLAGRGANKNIKGCQSIEQLCMSLERPRKVMILIKAGRAVDDTIDMLVPFLEQGDVIIDGGNSHYPDTIRRCSYVESKGLLYVGAGVSGGEEGALLGPSIMPGGSSAAWPLVKPMFQKIAAQTNKGEACCEWVGEDGAGHFVKTVHNGIEYADMQMIAEVYGMMRDGAGLAASDIAPVFRSWNRGPLASYLIEVTGEVLGTKDPQTGEDIVDLIVDQAGQKGTGRWTVIEAV